MDETTVNVKRILNEQMVRPIKEYDWVGLRALYLLLATDASAISSAEVRRILEYYQDKYGDSMVQKAIEMLSLDNAIRGTFAVTDVYFARRLDKSIVIREEGFADFVEDIAKEQPSDQRPD